MSPGAALSLALLPACGGPLPTRGPDATTSPDGPSPDSGTADDPAFEPARHVTAYPDELMFYSELDSATARDPRQVTVQNTTFSSVQITAVYVVDASTLTEQATGDSDYFTVEPLDLDSPLATGDTLRVPVTFSPSSQLRTALLVIETTHPSYTSLVVELSGKTFVSY